MARADGPKILTTQDRRADPTATAVTLMCRDASDLWNAPQACLWIATQDEVAVPKLEKNHTFAVLAFRGAELIDMDSTTLWRSTWA